MMVIGTAYAEAIVNIDIDMLPDDQRVAETALFNCCHYVLQKITLGQTVKIILG